MEKKRILVGISGGIAIYKACQLVSNLSKTHEVQVVMTSHAKEFMSPLTFETLTGRPVYSEMFGPGVDHSKVPHIDLAKWADLIVIVPATANFLAKMAHGLADDLMSSMMLAARSPVLVCPAMNTYMLAHEATQENIHILESRGIHVLNSSSGLLACGDYGAGKLPEPGQIQDIIESLLIEEKDLAGLNVTITAGPTREALDPVRFISNHSSGKMGYALAQAARDRGARVRLISGPVSIDSPSGVELYPVESAQDMFEAVQNLLDDTDMLIKAAAVADYRPKVISDQKIKKSDDDLTLSLERNPDILAWAGEHKKDRTVLCGFAMETRDLLKNARKKLESKHCDLLVANSLKEEGAGFGTDTNVATLLWPDREETLPMMSKKALAHKILDALVAIKEAK